LRFYNYHITDSGDIDLIGTADKLLDLGDREISGRVRLVYVILGKLVLKPGARLILGPGVRFKHARDIPPRLDLTDIFVKIPGKAEKCRRCLAAIDLSRNVAEGMPSLREAMQAVLSGITLAQEADSGNLLARLGGMTYVLKPVRVRQAEHGARPGLRWTVERRLAIVTAEGQEVETVPAVENLASFIQGLTDIGLQGLQVEDDGRLSAEPVNGSGQRYVGMADLTIEDADTAEPFGITIRASALFPAGNRLLRALVFKDKQGHKRRQTIHPYAAYPDLLRFQQPGDSNADSVDLHPDGSVSFSLNGLFYRGLLGYGVIAGLAPDDDRPPVEFRSTVDLNGDSVADFEIVYPNGDRQVVYTIVQ